MLSPSKNPASDDCLAKPKRRKLRQWIALMSSGVLLMVTALCTCMNPLPMPVVDEASAQNSSLAEVDAGFKDTLQIIWFGSACHEIRLGKLSIVTDPFVTNGLRLRKLESNRDRVNETLAMLHPPAAVLVNHSHYDHLLDAHAALSLPGWENVPLYGGETCKNLLAGWQNDQVTDRCLRVNPTDDILPKVPSGYHLKITAYPGVHAPHAGCSTVLFSGRVTTPLGKQPDSPWDFKLGEVYNYLIEMEHGVTKFKVFFLGGPGNAAVLPKIDVDVVILPSPGAERVDNYPAGHLAQLQPRHIVVNHYNNLFACDPDKARDTQANLLRIDVAKLNYLSREIQKAVVDSKIPNNRFERLHLPAISVMDSKGEAKNVIRIVTASRISS